MRLTDEKRLLVRREGDLNNQKLGFWCENESFCKIRVVVGLFSIFILPPSKIQETLAGAFRAISRVFVRPNDLERFHDFRGLGAASIHRIQGLVGPGFSIQKLAQGLITQFAPVCA